MGFYDLTASERTAITRQAINERRTVMERWSSLGEAEAAPWSLRSARAAELLADCRAVADIGCGMMSLRSYLAPGTRYVPVDVVSRGVGTVVVDLNREALPELGVDGFALLGLLEYLFDVPALLRQLQGTVVVTYNPRDLCEQDRLQHAWVNDYDTAELERHFTAAGFAIEQRVVLDTQMLWRLRR